MFFVHAALTDKKQDEQEERQEQAIPADVVVAHRVVIMQATLGNAGANAGCSLGLGWVGWMVPGLEKQLARAGVDCGLWISRSKRPPVEMEMPSSMQTHSWVLECLLACPHPGGVCEEVEKPQRRWI